MPAGYAPIPNPPSAPDADRELNEAFESESDSDNEDGEDTHESTPLTSTYHSNSTRRDIPVSVPPSNPIPGTYDFERDYDYDYPPPGSPPPPSSTALPNNYGNSNGRLPTSPVLVSIPTSRPQPSFFRRAVGAILPTHYVRVPTDGTGMGTSTSRRGGGTENDGVFANVMAKPTLSRVVQTEDGDVRLVPEDNQKEPPPTYADAQLDAVPPYWETTVHAPSGTDPSSSMIIDDLPTGSLLIFGVNLFISFFFQFVGFVLTYLLHTSHAAKFGSRAGLGLTLIQYGFYSRTMLVGGGGETGTGGSGVDTDVDVDGWTGVVESEDTSPVGSITSKEWLSFLLMTLGWFLLLSSIAGFWRVKRWERSIRRSSSTPSEITPEAIERDIAIRRNLASVFGIGIGMGMGMGSNGGGDGGDGDGEEEERRERRMLDDEESRIRTDEHGNVIVIPAQELLEEARLERSLRNAGIL